MAAVTPAIAAIYPDAVDLAVKETGLPAKPFPMGCAYQPRDILADDYYPSLVGGRSSSEQ